MPVPELLPDSPFAAQLIGLHSDQQLLEAGTGISDDQLRRYMGGITDYTSSLRNWLDAVEAARADRLRVFEGRLRIQELGQAPADHVRLRLRFPAGFDVDGELPKVPLRPQRPSFDGRIPLVTQMVGRLHGETYMQPNLRIRLPGTDRPNYSTEDGHVIVDWDLGRVNQSEHRDVPAFETKAAEPGTYEVDWQITAEGLPKPAEGTIRIEVQAPEPAEPITKLADVESERKAYELAFSPSRPG